MYKKKWMLGIKLFQNRGTDISGCMNAKSHALTLAISVPTS
jgi:hypothetical protein